MSKFLRLLNESHKEQALESACTRLREGESDSRVFDVEPESFKAIPGEPFAYWVSRVVRETFVRLPPFEGENRTVKQGLATADDFRFVRLWWETGSRSDGLKWLPFIKGGYYSPFYADVYSTVNWSKSGDEIRNFLDPNTGKLYSRPQNTGYYRQPGLTWPLRGVRFSAQIVPSGCVFSIAGKMAFAPNQELGYWLAIFNSSAFDYLVRLFAGKVGGVQYEVGLIARIPVAGADSDQAHELAELARRGWSVSRAKASTAETSPAFALPGLLRKRLGDYDPSAIETVLARVQAEIDAIAFDLYGFSKADREMAQGGAEIESTTDAEDEDTGRVSDASEVDALLSWVVGVAFGRFDWRLATGEQAPPAEPEPFDPLPAKSPGMRLDDSVPFHRQPGILVDDPGHEHDLPRLIEAVIANVDAPVDQDLRRWLRRDFFKYHLQQYSRSRRKAPIYWPLSTASGQYTLWVYYPDLTSQTLFTAVNDFVEPKLQDVQADLAALRGAGTSRTRAQEKELEPLTDLETELLDFRETLLRIAPGYKPDQDDGVQITAAPLWPLFRDRNWQRILRETWEKLEAGDYDWAKLAMAYWPERGRGKCVTDKSLAIAHNLEHLYEEPEAKSHKAGRR